MQRFRGGLVFKARIFLSLCSRLESNRVEERSNMGRHLASAHALGGGGVDLQDAFFRPHLRLCLRAWEEERTGGGVRSKSDTKTKPREGEKEKERERERESERERKKERE